MARNEVDQIDIGALTLAPIAAAMVLGVFSLEVSVFGVGSLNQSLIDAGGAAITIPLIVFIASVGWIVGTNELDGSDYEDYEYGVIAFAFLSIPLYEFVPAFQTLVEYSDVGRLVLALVIAAAIVMVSYVE